MRKTCVRVGVAGEAGRRVLPCASIASVLLASALAGLIGSVSLADVYATGRPDEPLQESAPQADRHEAAASRSVRLFGSDAGLVLNFIKPDKTEDFEAVVMKLREALQKSDKPERKLQAAGWKVFKAAEPGANGSVLYVFVIDPAAKGADYTVSTILAEAFPTEVQALYQKYAGAYAAGQNFVNLALVSTLGQ